MNREDQIIKIGAQFAIDETDGQTSGRAASMRGVLLSAFRAGAHWADSHPQWYDAQGDNVPEYGREVIVIGRDGKVFYGHRPNPKEVTMIDGKPYHAKTYDKNGWNWPDIALWLDVEIPHELIEQITHKWFEENEQKRNSKLSRV